MSMVKRVWATLVDSGSSALITRLRDRIAEHLGDIKSGPSY